MYTAKDLVAKRLLDVGVAAAGLLAAGPLFAAVAVLVKLSSDGPVFFKQVRVGRHGREFRLVKFRTMRAASGPKVTASGDPRTTAVGRVLRQSKVDELPSLLNVLCGDLSLVGPRPEVPEYVALYPASDRALLQQVRPGLTDPATVAFRNEEEILASKADPQSAYVAEILPEKLRLCREYLARASFFSDLGVLTKTAVVIIAPGLVSR